MGPLIKERFPSVVDTDDLIYEIGKQVVRNINLEKLLNKMLEKSNRQSKDIEKIKSLTESNKLYEENNRRLDAEIVRLREKIISMRAGLSKIAIDEG